MQNNWFFHQFSVIIEFLQKENVINWQCSGVWSCTELPGKLSFVKLWAKWNTLWKRKRICQALRNFVSISLRLIKSASDKSNCNNYNNYSQNGHYYKGGIGYLGYIKPKAVIMTMWRRGFLKHLEKGSGDRFDSCLSCEYSILREGFEFINGTSGESS